MLTQCEQFADEVGHVRQASQILAEMRANLGVRVEVQV